MRIAILLAFCSVALSAQTVSVAQLALWDDQPDKTLAQLWGTAAQNPKSAAARVNISYALLSMNRLQQAEWAARESLDLDPANTQAQLILGWTLAREYRYTAEALDYLRRAARAYPVDTLALPTCWRIRGRRPKRAPNSRLILRPAKKITASRPRTGSSFSICSKLNLLVKERIPMRRTLILLPFAIAALAPVYADEVLYQNLRRRF